MSKMQSTPSVQQKGNFKNGFQGLLLGVLFLLACTAAIGFGFHWLFQRDYALVSNVTSDADVVSGLKAMSDAEIEGLKNRETRAFLADPLDRLTMKNLVMLHEVGMKKDDSGEIYDILVAFTKRNISVQVGAINSNLQSGNVAKAMFHLDALLRAHPQLGKAIYPVLYPVLNDNKAVAALAKVLRSRPTWRRDFMNELAEHDPESTISYKLFTNLRKQNAAIEDSEFRYLFANLIGKKQFDKAYFVWLDFLPAEDLADIKLIYDGGFNRTPRNLFFDWNIDARPNARIAIAKRNEAPSDLMLKLEFFQDREEFYHLYQYLQLPPGQFAVSFDTKAEQINMPAGLRWRLRCAANSEVMGESEKFLESQPWTTQTFPVNIPDENCDTQILRLEAVTRAVLDQKYDGQLYFDNFKIEKLNAEGGGTNGTSASP